MRHTIEGFSQVGMINLGLDVIDSVILRFIVDFYLSGRMEKITVDDKEWFWVGLGYLMQELPILEIERRQLSNRIDKMVASGLLEKKQVPCGQGSKLYVRFNDDVYMGLLSDEAYLAMTPEIEVQRKEERRRAKELFTQYYRIKAKEFTGEEKDPLWGAKEGALLKADARQLDQNEMRRCIRQFFSDSVPEVADFTRIKNKAGYSYTVFHGMIPKLAMTTGEPKNDPCRDCGAWKNHRPGCPTLAQLVVDRQATTQAEIDEAKAATENIDMAAMFNNAIGRKVLDTSSASY